MKKIAISLIFLINSLLAYSQSNPVKWSLLVNNTKDSSIYNVKFIAEIEKNWQLYSNDFNPNLGPIITEFKYTVSNTFDLDGPTYPKDSKRKYDDLWGGEYTYFENHAEFNQSIKSVGKSPRIEVNITYQVCNTVDGKCIPFEITLNNSNE